MRVLYFIGIESRRSCWSTYIKVFHRNGYVYMHTVQSYMDSECALWKSKIWPGQRSCTWPIFQLGVTLDLKYICPNFIILRLIVLELSWKRTDGRTDGHTRRWHKKHSCGILNNGSFSFLNTIPLMPCFLEIWWIKTTAFSDHVMEHPEAFFINLYSPANFTDEVGW